VCPGIRVYREEFVPPSAARRGEHRPHPGHAGQGPVAVRTKLPDEFVRSAANGYRHSLLRDDKSNLGEYQGSVPSLLLPSTVGVAGSPAAIGVITGVEAPMSSTIFSLFSLTTQTSPEPSSARPAGALRLPPV
jgi:hypothetical protein